MVHVITGTCCNDARCVHACPLDVIHPRPDEPEFATAEMLHIDPATCIDCGACADACPVDAIIPITKLEPAQKHYVQVNAEYFTDRPVAPESIGPTRAIPVLPEERGRLRVAIIGSGPSGMYAAEELLRHRDVEVDVYERLLTPWGLVRFGVAPDHPDTKAVSVAFEALAREPNLRLRLGVTVGRDVNVEELQNHYHAVIVATGAKTARILDVPGSHLAGSVSATDFASWYNGHPDSAAQLFDLSERRAVVVGNGNVALDIARVLLTDPDTLSATDIAPHALAALTDSEITEVVVLGRRSPREAAFTESELTALADLDDVDITVDAQTAASGVLDPHADDDPIVRRKLEFLRTHASAAGARSKSVHFIFNTAITEVCGRRHVYSVRTNSAGHNAVLPTGLVVQAIGHDSAAVPGVPYDAVARSRDRLRRPARARRALARCAENARARLDGRGPRVSRRFARHGMAPAGLRRDRPAYAVDAGRVRRRLRDARRAGRPVGERGPDGRGRHEAPPCSAPAGEDAWRLHRIARALVDPAWRARLTGSSNGGPR